MDIEEIADDIFEVIGQYLCWIEKIAFKRTSKKLSAIIKEETIEELIEKRLTYLGIEGKNIIQELKKTNTVISGSFILQCIYNVSWKDSDIDFFFYYCAQFFTRSFKCYFFYPTQILPYYF